MTDRPIIFSAPMVRALLAGRKTQTRRLATSPLRRCEVGDRLYVREAWACHWAADDQQPRDIDPALWSVRYLCDDYVRPAERDRSLALADQCKRGRPSIHMPRWASRLTLIVEGAKVEPLGHMIEACAVAEGIYCERGEGWTADGAGWFASPKIAFHGLWDSLHTAEGERWQDNPDVVALTFRVVRGNIDQVTA